ncbi:MAG: flagellar biosynthesis protein FlhA [Planctomycetes bacterium]|nr:flagellar biosynthesis protein FlhA [Planctomycetota bacterium]
MGIAETIGRNKDLLFVFGTLAVLVVIIVQLPPVLMDVLLVVNLTIAVVILLTTIYVEKPLEFSVFPSLLLMTTFYRLALNIATTRLILGRTGEAGETTTSAGRVVQAFGEFVAGNNVVVGFVVFSIIVIIQFVVITKGATRISEVAARFTLDAMPGKQLSIDADLNAGLIDEATARKRREAVTREADFYGAMDGASKFVRGDAIAGVIITLVNIVGGLLIGTLWRGMDLRTASEVFARLTIGDGLVSQVPAVVISISAGLIVTRSTARADLGTDVVGQVFANPKALGITGGFLILLLASGLPKLVLIGAAAFCGSVAYFLRSTRKSARREEEAAARKAAEKPAPEAIKDRVLALDPLELEVGYGLVPLVDSASGGDLLARIGMIREKIAADLGFVVPAIRIRDNLELKPQEYAIKLRGIPIARATIQPGHHLAMDTGEARERIDGIETTEPAFGLRAIWIPEAHRARAEALGYTVVDPPSVIATHLTEILRRHAGDLLTREEVASLLEKVKKTSPAVVNELVPDVLKAGDIQKVLQNLLRERISIRDLETILETLADWAPRTKDPEILTEYARHALGRAISHTHRDADGRIHAVALDPVLEDFVEKATERTDRGARLSLNPELANAVVARTAEELEKLLASGRPPVVVCAPQVRSQVRKLLERQIQGLAVLSYGEIVREVPLEIVGTVRMET